MKILQIRFSNLNSLTGEWTIDLTSPEFASDGIFAITGPTGAGKSTILDAVCLALYGQTPRLGRITKGTNEIMSRLRGDCFAEVVFETRTALPGHSRRTGRFRCHWSQHRARKRPGGELQNPKHEISEAGSDRILETGKKGVAEQVEAITGLNFDRFTRSMLLAQGGFAAFLQAGADQRSPILEQITGTAIYSEISREVHVRKTAERSGLDIAEAGLGGIVLPDPEEEQALLESLAAAEEASRVLAFRQSLCNRVAGWIKSMADLDLEAKKIDARENELLTKKNAFKPDACRLELSVRAASLDACHAPLESLRRLQDEDRRALARIADSLPGLENAVLEAAGGLKSAASLVETLESSREAKAEKVKAVRDLDTRISEWKSRIEDARRKIELARAGSREAQARAEEMRGSMEADSAALAEISARIASMGCDSRLVEAMGSLRRSIADLGKAAKDSAARIALFGEGEEKLSQALESLEDARACRENLRMGADKCSAEVVAAREACESTAGGRSPEEIMGRIDILKDRRNLLERAVGEMSRSVSVASGIAKLRQSLDAAAVEIEECESEVESLVGLQESVARERELLETQAVLLDRILSLEELRRELSDGVPCPLCGSPDHPFARGNVPGKDANSEALDRVRRKADGIAATISEFRSRTAAARARAEGAVERIAAEENDLAGIVDSIKKIGADLEIDSLTGEKAGAALRECISLLGAASADLAAAAAAGKNLVAAVSAETIAKEALTAAEAAVLRAEGARGAAADLLGKAREEVESHRERFAAAFRQARNELSEFMTPLPGELDTSEKSMPDESGLSRILDDLEARRSRWVDANSILRGLEKSIAVKASEAAAAETLTQSRKGELEAAEIELLGLEKVLQAHVENRTALFGTGNPDDEEAASDAALKAALKALGDARESHGRLEMDHKMAIAGCRAMGEAVAGRGKTLEAAESDFRGRIEETGFPDERVWMAARLPQNEHSRLLAEAEAISSEGVLLSALSQETALKTEILKSTDPLPEMTAEFGNPGASGWPLETVEALAADMVNSQADLQQKIGAMREKAVQFDQSRDKRAAMMLEIETRRAECTRWETLHNLIGSADGKKFRNFAQGLTFDMVISRANAQLAKMTDRYLLSRDGEIPLELNVIDSHQAGETRSTRNLSGGESFIVSLALALGLSQMASRCVQVDSLFLDEGFGTLDEEALETALSALSGLRREGKLIGVISHVQALKERIPARIRVIPATGGSSLLAGPGCRRTG